MTRPPWYGHHNAAAVEKIEVIPVESPHENKKLLPVPELPPTVKWCRLSTTARLLLRPSRPRPRTARCRYVVNNDNDQTLVCQGQALRQRPRLATAPAVAGAKIVVAVVLLLCRLQWSCRYRGVWLVARVHVVEEVGRVAAGWCVTASEGARGFCRR